MSTGRRRYDAVAIVIMVLALLAIAAFRSEFRLRSAMPPGFFDVKRVAPEKQGSEERIARAYWNCAVTQVQWKYGYAHRLPDQPVEEFRLNVGEVGPVAQDEVARRYYWQQLRMSWDVTSAWETTWSFSFVALRQSLQTGGEWWKELVHSIVGD